MASPQPQAPAAENPDAGHLAPPLEDPGKRDRVARGVPVVAAFDGYRAWAVSAIVLFHLLAASELLPKAGASLPAQAVFGTLPWSIAVFFIVSGFVMFLPTVAKEGDFGRISTFAIRRAARLFPALWLALTVVLILLAVLPKANYPVPGIGEILLNFSGQVGWASLFDQGYVAGFDVDGPVWTLTLELGFYVVLPFVAGSFFRRPLVGLAVAAAITILWLELFAHLPEVVDFLNLPISNARLAGLEFGDNQLPLWAFAFATGMAVAWGYVHLDKRHRRAALERVAPRVVLAALLACGVCAYFAGRYVIGNPGAVVVYLEWQSAPLMIAYTGSLGILMLAIAMMPSRLQLPVAHPLVRQLADISYGVYLIHAVLIWALAVQFGLPENSPTSFVLLLVTVVPLSLAYGYLSTRFLEQPIRRWAQRYGRRAQAQPAAEGTRAPSPSGLPG